MWISSQCHTHHHHGTWRDASSVTLSLLPPCLPLKVTAGKCTAPGWVAGARITAQGPALCSTGAPWEAAKEKAPWYPTARLPG